MIKCLVSLFKRINSDPIIKKCILYYIFLVTGTLILLWLLPNKCWDPETDFLAVLFARPWLIILLLIVAWYLTDKEYYMEKDHQQRIKNKHQSYIENE